MIKVIVEFSNGASVEIEVMTLEEFITTRNDASRSNDK
jgi:hypothetical protein